MTWKNGRQLATLTNGDTSISYGYDSGSVRTTKTVNGVKYTYAYLNGQLMYETRGDAKFYYSYDANGILYNVRYTLTDGGTEYSYYYTHNSRGDIVGIYNGAGELKVHYEYDAWGNVISITDNNGNAITNLNHIGNLNPFRYRGYYQDTETGLYYLMSRYYDPVTHRFINADGYFQSGGNILDANMHSYCGNNPIMFADPTGLCYEPQYTSVGTYIGKYWVIKTAVRVYRVFVIVANLTVQILGTSIMLNLLKIIKIQKEIVTGQQEKTLKKGQKTGKNPAIANVMLLIPTARNIVGFLKATE